MAAREVVAVTGEQTIGILCERVRVEEKQMLEAFGLEHLPAEPVLPLFEPVALDPAGEGNRMLSGHRLLIDRCANRTAACHLVAVAGDLGIEVIGAGIASRGTRLDVARALARAGVARPKTLLIGSEEAGMAALQSTGFPATLMPLSFSKEPQPVFDRDIAEAVLEHRHTLLAAPARTMLVQAGSPSIAETLDVFVVDGVAAASSHAGKPALRQPGALRLGEAAAEALDAETIGIRLVMVGGAVVVWDVDPVPDFRHLGPLVDRSVAQTIAGLLARRLGKVTGATGAELAVGAAYLQEAARDAVAV
jgi:hypothetical protein